MRSIYHQKWKYVYFVYEEVLNFWFIIWRVIDNSWIQSIWLVGDPCYQNVNIKKAKLLSFGSLDWNSSSLLLCKYRYDGTCSICRVYLIKKKTIRNKFSFNLFLRHGNTLTLSWFTSWVIHRFFPFPSIIFYQRSCLFYCCIGNVSEIKMATCPVRISRLERLSANGSRNGWTKRKQTRIKNESLCIAKWTTDV